MVEQVTCVGTINWDVILDVETVPDPDCSEEMQAIDEGVGGSATNTSLVLSEITNWNLNIVGQIGDDDRGKKVRSILKSKGISPILPSEGRTNLIYAVITEKADPRYFHKYISKNHIDLDDEIVKEVRNSDHLHVTSFSLKTVEKILDKVNLGDTTVSFNPTQGYASNDFSSVMECVDIAILNDREAEIFKERNDFDEFIENNCLVVTHGAAGSTVYDKGKVFNHSGYSTEKPLINTIGAGDAFTAGFLSEYLNGSNHDEALKYANALGALSTTKNGSMESITKTEVQEIID